MTRAEEIQVRPDLVEWAAAKNATYRAKRQVWRDANPPITAADIEAALAAKAIEELPL